MSLALTLGAALWGCSKASEVNENAVLLWESGVFCSDQRASLCTREALAGCLLFTKFVPNERINSSLKKAALRGGLNPGRRTCRGFG